MASKEMSTLTLNGTEYEIVDAESRDTKLSKTGGIMTGRLYIKSSNISDGTTPSEHTYGQAIEYIDSTSGNNRLGYMQPVTYTTGNQGIILGGSRTVSGSTVSNQLGLFVDASGNMVVRLSQTAWRDALGIECATGDSGWQTLTLDSAFTLYTAGAPVKYRKVGNTVEVRGVIQPASEIAAGGSARIGQLPSGYRPDTTRYFICQGSGQNKWLLIITSSSATNPGEMSFNRYGGDTAAAAGTNAWLPFNATFIAG